MDFKIREWNLNDVESIVKYANNKRIAANLTDQFPHPYKREDGKVFIEMAIKEDPTALFAIEINDEACGGIGIHLQKDIHKKNAELGYWLAEPYWGMGIMTEAVLQIINYGFKAFDITRIFARPFGTNIASQKVLIKAGFSFEGKFEKTLFKGGKYLDELIYAVRR